LQRSVERANNLAVSQASATANISIAELIKITQQNMREVMLEYVPHIAHHILQEY